MKVKELIEKLQEHDPDMRAVVDSLEGFLDVYEFVSEGGTGGPDHENVVIISMESIS